MLSSPDRTLREVLSIGLRLESEHSRFCRECAQRLSAFDAGLNLIKAQHLQVLDDVRAGIERRRTAVDARAAIPPAPRCRDAALAL